MTEQSNPNNSKGSRGPASPINRGSKWTIRWRDEDGLQRHESFRLQKEAGERLRAELHRVAKVKAAREAGEDDPLPPKPRPAKKFSDIAEHWQKHRETRFKEDDASILRAHLVPAFGDDTLDVITYETIEVFKAEKRKTLGAKTLHNVLTLLISMLNEAVDLGWITKRPTVNGSSRITVRRQQDRRLSTAILIERDFYARGELIDQPLAGADRDLRSWARGFRFHRYVQSAAAGSWLAGRDFDLRAGDGKVYSGKRDRIFRDEQCRERWIETAASHDIRLRHPGQLEITDRTADVRRDQRRRSHRQLQLERSPK